MIEFKQTLLPVPVRPAIQQVRQRRQIHDQRSAGHVLAQINRDPHLLGLAARLFHHFAEMHDLPVVVGHFDAHGVFAGQRGHNTHARHAQGNSQIVGQPRDAAQTQSGLQFHLELSDNRAGLDFHHADIESEVGEGFFQYLRLTANLFFLFVETECLAPHKQFQRGQFIVRGLAAYTGFVHFVKHFLVRLGRFWPADAHLRAECFSAFGGSGLQNLDLGFCLFRCFGRCARFLVSGPTRHTNGHLSAFRTNVNAIEVGTASPVQLLRIGRAHLQNTLADFARGPADGPGQQPHQHIVG